MSGSGRESPWNIIIRTVLGVLILGGAITGAAVYQNSQRVVYPEWTPRPKPTPAPTVEPTAWVPDSNLQLPPDPNGHKAPSAGAGPASQTSAPRPAPVVRQAPLSQGLAAAVTRVRIVPFTTAQGQSAQMALVDWKNTGGVQIRKVVVDLKVYDAAGNLIESNPRTYIYTAWNSQSGVQPGEEHHTPEGDGWIIQQEVGSAPAARAEATIAEISETSMDM